VSWWLVESLEFIEKERKKHVTTMRIFTATRN